MNNEEYLKTQEQIIILAEIVKDMPLKEFIEAGDRADTIGPFLDPSLWRAGNENLAVILNMARELMVFQSKASGYVFLKEGSPGSGRFA